MVMQTAIASSKRNIRLESRTDFCKTGHHSLQIGASLSVGDSYVNATRLYIGTQPTLNITPTDLLTVNGTVAFNNGASAIGAMELTGSITSSNVIGPSTTY